jgi:1-acyl-sn-glycerol-3-phosphate acyltransferase
MTSAPAPQLVSPVPPSGRNGRLVRRLGVDRLWGRDPARAWRLAKLGAAPVLARLARGTAIYGVERIPESGGVLIAANHFTALDPFVVGVPARRSMHFFAKGQLFHRSLLTEAILWLGAIPVGHKADNRAALRQAIDLLEAGRVVGIFIEGERRKENGLGEAMPGAALLALRAGVPVVPCGLDTHGWSKKRRRQKRCTVVFGEPIRLGDLPPGREGVEQATEVISVAVDGAWRAAVDAGEEGRPEMLADGARRTGWRQAWLHALLHRARS